MSKTIPFQTIQFSISTLFCSIWLIDRTLSGATTLDQNEPRSSGNEGVFPTPQSSSITGTSPWDCFVSYPGHSSGGGLTPLQRCSQCILQSQLTGQVDLMSLAQRMHFLQNMFLMTATALVSVITHYHINGLHLFRDTLYMPQSSMYQNIGKLLTHPKDVLGSIKSSCLISSIFSLDLNTT